MVRGAGDGGFRNGCGSITRMIVAMVDNDRGNNTNLCHFFGIDVDDIICLKTQSNIGFKA